MQDACIAVTNGSQLQLLLSAICRAVGVVHLTDSCELHDRPLLCKVRVERRIDIDDFTNVINGYHQRPNASAPAPVTAAPVPSTPPWQRPAPAPVTPARRSRSVNAIPIKPAKRQRYCKHCRQAFCICDVKVCNCAGCGTLLAADITGVLLLWRRGGGRMTGIRVTKKAHLGHGRNGRQQLNVGESPPEVPRGRIPRVTRLMALAIRFDQLFRDGVVADYAELARLAHVTQPRMTQIMKLLLLAPDIQEALLFLPRVERGKDPVTERDLRAIVAEVDWGRQREVWMRIG